MRLDAKLAGKAKLLDLSLSLSLSQIHTHTCMYIAFPFPKVTTRSFLWQLFSSSFFLFLFIYFIFFAQSTKRNQQIDKGRSISTMNVYSIKAKNVYVIYK